MNHVVCLKHGTKYSADYVNALYNMVRRNLTVPFEFTCFTENSNGINSEIQIRDLPLTPKIAGWWYKPMFFDPKLGLKGTILFLDLDVVIFKNIDNLFSYNTDKFCIIKDFNRCVNKNWQKMNSSVFRFNTGMQSHVYTKFISNPENVTRRFQGDQDWIFNQVKENWCFWPDEWIQSYKWEMRGNPKLVWKNDHKDFEHIAEPLIKQNTCIAVFHGDPKPELCLDPWVRKYWK